MFLVASDQPLDRDTIDDTEGKKLLRLLWLSYLNMWGPPYRHKGQRRQHRWRLHQLMDFMDEFQSEAGLHPGPEWDEWCRTLPGFLEYWYNFDSYHRHHHEG